VGGALLFYTGTKKAALTAALQRVKKVAAATFLSDALTHWSLRSRAFVRVRKRFCKQNRAKIAAHVADFRWKVEGPAGPPTPPIGFLTA